MINQLTTDRLQFTRTGLDAYAVKVCVVTQKGQFQKVQLWTEHKQHKTAARPSVGCVRNVQRPFQCQQVHD